MAKLIGWVYEIETAQGLDEDKIHENFSDIEAVYSVQYQPGVWGDPARWTIEVRLEADKFKSLPAVVRKIDRAVKVRKAKKGTISETFGRFVDGRYRQMHDEMMARGGPFSNVTFVPAK